MPPTVNAMPNTMPRRYHPTMRRTFAPRLAALAAGLALTLAACGGDDNADTTDSDAGGDTIKPPTVATSDDNATSSLDVCALLTNEQVEEAIGAPVVATHPGGGQGFATGACGWELATETSDPGLPDFTMSVKTPGGRDQFDILADQMPAIPGLGDAAFQQGESIWAVSGDNLVVVSYGFLNTGADDDIAVLAPLIQTVLDQL